MGQIAQHRQAGLPFQHGSQQSIQMGGAVIEQDARQMQQLFYGKRYSATCLRRRKGCPAECKGPNEACPPYTPDFIKLVESYGGHGIRVEKEEDIDAAFAEAKKYKDVPVIIEFMIATDEIVLPMVKSGNPMSEMILK